MPEQRPAAGPDDVAEPGNAVGVGLDGEREDSRERGGGHGAASAGEEEEQCETPRKEER